MAESFKGRVALVTGAGSGMGQRMCERLANGGAAVAALDVDVDGLARTAAVSDAIHPMEVDVSDRGAVEKAVAQVVDDLGPIDRVVTAAAIMPSDPVAEMDPDLVMRVMQVNYGGTVLVTRTVLPQMLARGRGDVITFASLLGHVPQLYMGAYAASKHAVKAWAETLFWENQDSGLRFACVCPPAVSTPLLGQMKPDARVFLDVVPASTTLTPDRVLDAVEEGLARGRFWVMPGIAGPSAAYYRMAPRLYWKGARKIVAKHGS